MKEDSFNIHAEASFRVNLPLTTKHPFPNVSKERPGTSLSADSNGPPENAREAYKVVDLWDMKGWYVVRFVP